MEDLTQPTDAALTDADTPTADLNYVSTRVATQRMHAGVILRHYFRDDTKKKLKNAKPERWLVLVIQLTDENDDYGKPFEVECEMSSSMANESNLRRVLQNLRPSYGQNVLARIAGMEVDVAVTVDLGNNPHYPFAKVIAPEVWRRGEGKEPYGLQQRDRRGRRSRQVATIIPDDPSIPTTPLDASVSEIVVEPVRRRQRIFPARIMKTWGQR